VTAIVQSIHALPDAGTSERDVSRNDDVTPPRDEHRRLFDATRISFPLQMVIYIVSATLAAMLGVWGASNGQNQRYEAQTTKIDKLDSKFELVLEKFTSQQLVKEQESKLAEERMSNMRETMRKMEARIEMIQIQQATRDKELNDSLLQLKSRR
jgi:hypothetical protein